jgi:GNAT superfamily N-acetyltransferase
MTSSSDKPVKLTFRPVTTATKGDFEALFESPGGPSYCWCMYTRLTKGEAKTATNAPSRKPMMMARIENRVTIGLVGYDKGTPVAWVSIAPRETFSQLKGPEAAEGEAIWSLSCMYIQRKYRGAGLGHQLIDAAVKYARKRKADIVEVYAVDPDSPSYRNMGFVPAYEKAGFNRIEKLGSRRTIMRLAL